VKGVPEVYNPAAWFTPTFNVAPTVSTCEPPESVPVPEGVLVNEFTDMVFPPLLIVNGVDGNVMVYVYEPSPVTVKEAAEIVPATTGNVTPPVLVRTPAGVKITVPATALTATFPKFISTVFEMAIGVMIVAEAVAVADTCANVVERNPKIIIVVMISFFIVMQV
jgi:hypothetical protein